MVENQMCCGSRISAFVWVLKYLILHKWYVFLECRKFGLLWRGVTHDLSKFLPSEFMGLVRWRVGGRWPLVATLRHFHRNDHHWQHWVFINENCESQPRLPEMPLVCVKEMIADWRVAALLQGNDVHRWYRLFREHIWLSVKVREFVEENL